MPTEALSDSFECIGAIDEFIYLGLSIYLITDQCVRILWRLAESDPSSDEILSLCARSHAHIMTGRQAVIFTATAARQ